MSYNITIYGHGIGVDKLRLIFADVVNDMREVDPYVVVDGKWNYYENGVASDGTAAEVEVRPPKPVVTKPKRIVTSNSKKSRVPATSQQGGVKRSPTRMPLSEQKPSSEPVIKTPFGSNRAW